VQNRCKIRIGPSTTGTNGIRAELRGEPAGYLHDAPTYKGRQDVTRIIGNIMLVHSGFPNAKELLCKLSAVLTYTLKNVRQPCPRPQKFEGHQTISLPGAPIYLEPALSSRLRLKCDGTRAETRFCLSAKRTSPFKSAGASVQSITSSRGMRISFYGW